MTIGSADHPMLVPKVFYFLFYGAMAALIPYLNLHYEQIGLSSRQIGLLSGMSPLLSLVSAPLWGGLADATQRQRLLLILAIAGSSLAVLVLSLSTIFLWLIPVVAAYAFLMAPIMPLVDSTVVAALGNRKDEYGKQRLWGALGYGIAAPAVGSLIDSDGLRWAFTTYLTLMFANLFVALRLPVRRVSIRGQFRRGLRSLFSHRGWLVFLVTMLVGGIHFAFSMSFLFLYLNDLGMDKTLMGLSVSVATISELPVWFFADRFLERWGARRVLAVSLLACAIQAFAYSFARIPWLLLFAQSLHGPAFSAMWVAGVSYAAEIAPEGVKATAQGLFSGVTMGLRAAVGAFVGGFMYDSVGAVTMFRWGGAVALLALVFFVFAGERVSEIGAATS